MRWLSIILACLLMVGCSSLRRNQPTSGLTFWKVQRDTVYIPRDTIMMFPADSCLIQALVECDSTGKASLSEIQQLKNGKKVRQQMVIKDNVLQVEAIVDSAAIAARWWERVITVSDEKVITIEKKVNFIKGFQYFLIYSGIVFWVCSLIYALLRLLRIYLSKFKI